MRLISAWMKSLQDKICSNKLSMNKYRNGNQRNLHQNKLNRNYKNLKNLYKKKPKDALLVKKSALKLIKGPQKLGNFKMTGENLIITHHKVSYGKKRDLPVNNVTSINETYATVIQKDDAMVYENLFI